MISPLLRKFPPSRLGKLIEPEFVFGAHLQAVEGHVLDMYFDKGNNLSIQLPISLSTLRGACVGLRVIEWTRQEGDLNTTISPSSKTGFPDPVQEQTGSRVQR